MGGPAQFFRAYLAAYMFCLGITLGGMAILMLSYLTGGAWAYLIRRILEAQMSTLPLMALMFLPVAFGLETLYLWARPELVAADRNFTHSSFISTSRFSWIRAAIYFAIWLLIAFALAAAFAAAGPDRRSDAAWKFMRLSEVGLVLYGTTMHFAAFDWLEMLQPNYHSTIFPMLVVSSQLFSAQASRWSFWSLSRFAGKRPPSSRGACSSIWGTFCLAFLIICAYMLWFQFMLGWIANQPADALWFLPRVSGGWRAWLGPCLSCNLPFRSFCC